MPDSIITDEMVQQACLAYGGGAFPARMKAALEVTLNQFIDIQKQRSEREGKVLIAAVKALLAWDKLNDPNIRVGPVKPRMEDLRKALNELPGVNV